MRDIFSGWQFWALLSALFAALTAIFGKIGVERVSADFATLIRTVVILAFILAIVVATQTSQPLSSISKRTYVFLVLSGLATGASWLCYYRALKLGQASQVAPIDKLSVVFVALLATVFLGEHLSLKHWLGVAAVASGAVLLAV
jgi:transporter family protein